MVENKVGLRSGYANGVLVSPDVQVTVWLVALDGVSVLLYG